MTPINVTNWYKVSLTVTTVTTVTAVFGKINVTNLPNDNRRLCG